ncbi:MAG: thioesterase [Flavobacteriales bacterium]|nr:PaaI family thioesterase [Flavobacteriaceae bacterium]PHX91907.1 MAG: thioesterase [Flavobacteriales bacterium]
MNQELKAYMDIRLKANQFINYIGLELVDIDKNCATMQLKIQEHHMQHTGFTHGGVLATLCDVCTGIAAYTVVDTEKNVLTVDLKVSFVNPSTAPMVKATGQVIKAGQNLIFCEAEVWDVFANGDEKLVATCVSIMAAVDVRPKQQ